MEVSKLIQNMREQGIGIWTEGGKIRYLKKDGKLDDLRMYELMILEL